MNLQTEGGVCGQLRTLGAEEVVCVKIMPASHAAAAWYDIHVEY